MTTLKFKTNIMCGGCKARVTPFLDKANGINNWNVDTDNPSKILTINTDSLKESDIVQVLKEAGFNAEIVKQNILWNTMEW